MLFDEFDQYTQDLLLAQYEIADIIQHQLIKGEVREDFLIYILQSGFEPAPLFHKGTISDGITQAGQIDIMLCKPNSQVRRLGSQVILHPEDCLCVIEVKSNATGKDIRTFDERAHRIKQMRANSYPLCGIFCYKVELQEKTILNRFGYKFSAETQTYYDNDRNPRVLTYPNVDFFVSLDQNSPLFLRKKDDGRYTRIYEFPILKNVFQIVGSLIRTANPANNSINQVQAGTSTSLNNAGIS